MSHRAVLFDLDGTLLDTLEDIACSMNEALERLGFAPHPVEAYRKLVGDGVETLVARALPAAAREPRTLERGREAMLEVYARRWCETTVPYPGVGALLDGLAARGLPVAIFSNKPHEFTCLAVRGLLPSFSFARVLGVGEGTPRKPNPQGALAIAAEVGVPPAAWLYCGDTDTDMATASAAGMVAVGALWGFRSADELRAAGARHLLRRPEDLLELI